MMKRAHERQIAERNMIRRYTPTYGMLILASLSAAPIGYALNQIHAMKNDLLVLIVAAIVLTIVTVLPSLTAYLTLPFVAPIFYVLPILMFSSVIDLCLALENDGIISGIGLFYLREGEPYLQTAHGTMIMYWDGVVHYVLYFMILYSIASNLRYRYVALYWAASIGNSMLVFLPGNLLGPHGIKWSILLNIPYAIIPFWAAWRILRAPAVRTGGKKQVTDQGISGLRHVLDMLFIAYMLAAISLAVIRGLAVLGCTGSIFYDYTRLIEPYMTDVNAYSKVQNFLKTSHPVLAMPCLSLAKLHLHFAHVVIARSIPELSPTINIQKTVQMLIYMFYYVPYYVCCLIGLVSPSGQPWLVDWAVIHAGAAAQAQFSYIGASYHSRTSSDLHPPTDTRLISNIINGALFLVPQLLALRCLLYRNDFSIMTTAELPKKYKKL